MSDTNEEVFENNEEEVYEVEEVEEEEKIDEIVEPPKRDKRKRQLTDAQKEKLRENLKRGRETALANRRRKAKLRAIEKEEKITADEQKLLDALEKKKEKSEK